MPAEADGATLTLYLRKGCTGTAWFAGPEVVEIVPPALAIRLAGTYRERAQLDRGEATVRIETWIDSRALATPPAGQLAARARLNIGGQWRALEDSVQPYPQPWAGTLLHLGALAPGRYPLEVILSGGAGELGRASLTVEAPDPQAPLPTVYVKPQGDNPVLMVDGKPFFPLGLYLSDIKPEELKTIAAAGFNCVMPYGINGGSIEQIRAKLDAAQAAGLKVIYSVKDFYDKTQWRPKSVAGETDVDQMTAKVVTAFRDHPALLAWYLNDELPTSMHDTLARRYQQVRALDPNHPCWAVLYQVDSMARYADTCDILGADPYPIPTEPLSTPTVWTTKTRLAGAPGRALWMVPQVFDHACYEKDPAAQAKSRPPTLAEMRNMTCQCLLAGATGLIYYSWFDLQRDPKGFERRWADVKQVATEVKQLEPYLLSLARPLWQTPAAGGNPAVKAGLAPTADGERWLILAANTGSLPGVARLPALRFPLDLLCGQATAAGPGTIDLPEGAAAAFLMKRP
jgi:hypothetical protein